MPKAEAAEHTSPTTTRRSREEWAEEALVVQARMPEPMLPDGVAEEAEQETTEQMAFAPAETERMGCS